MAGRGLIAAMKKQLPATGRGHRYKGAAETPQPSQVHHLKSHKSTLVGMSENRTKGTLDPCVLSEILNSEGTELPANGGLCPCLRSHGEPARPAHPCFQLQPMPPSHKKVGTKFCLSNRASPSFSMGTNSLYHSHGNMNFL